MSWTLKEITDLCGNNCNLISAEPQNSVTGISIDTRTLNKGDIFIAIDGENTNGHLYIKSAFEKGAQAAIVKNVWAKSNVNGSHSFITADDTLKALQAWAKKQRETYNYKVVAITGSNGKTTTKEMTAAVLSTKFKTKKTEGNLNNHIGVPISILRFGKDINIGIVEMGANHVGEIKLLSSIAKPDIGIITNIGYGHIGLFGSIKKTTEAKFEMAENIRTNGILVLNADNKESVAKAKDISSKCFFYSIHNKKSDLMAENISFDENALPSFKVNGIEFNLQIPGIHSVYNALAAISAGIKMGIEIAATREPLCNAKQLNSRWTRKEVNGIIIIDDAYNANPSSVAAALETLSRMDIKGRRIAVIGDMLELGEYSNSLHYDIGEKAIKEKTDILCAYGEFAEKTIDGAVKAGCDKNSCKIFTDPGNLLDYLKNTIKTKDAVLFKGSQRMKLFEVAKNLENIISNKEI